MTTSQSPNDEPMSSGSVQVDTARGTFFGSPSTGHQSLIDGEFENSAVPFAPASAAIATRRSEGAGSLVTLLGLLLVGTGLFAFATRFNAKSSFARGDGDGHSLTTGQTFISGLVVFVGALLIAGARLLSQRSSIGIASSKTLVRSSVPSLAGTSHPESAASLWQRFAGLRGSMTNRVSAFDLVRTFAILGMISAHIGPLVSPQIGKWAWMRQIEGRAAGAFAILLGSSATLAYASRQPKIGAGRARGEQVLRGLALFVVGVVMTRWPTGVVVVLGTLGVASILVIPMLRWPARRAALLALFLAIVGPPFSYWIRLVVLKQDALELFNGKNQNFHILGIPKGDSFTSWSRFKWMFLDLLFTGVYPLITWMPLVLVGVALVRADVRSARVRQTIAFSSIALLVFRFAGMPLINRMFDLDRKIVAALEEKLPQARPGYFAGLIKQLFPGQTFTLDWRLLLYGQPHSGTTFEIASIVGVTLALLWLALFLGDRAPRLTRILSSPGRLAFTIYVTHVLARYAILQRAGGGSRSAGNEMSVLLVFLFTAIVLSTLWSVFVGQGPLEWALRTVTREPLKLFRKRQHQRTQFAEVAPHLDA
jgi:uncharacterized membrane protein YeiB